MRWETNQSFDRKLCQKYSYYKLSKSDNCFLSYSRKCRGCFLRHSVQYNKEAHWFQRYLTKVNIKLNDLHYANVKVEAKWFVEVWYHWRGGSSLHPPHPQEPYFCSRPTALIFGPSVFGPCCYAVINETILFKSVRARCITCIGNVQRVYRVKFWPRGTMTRPWRRPRAAVGRGTVDVIVVRLHCHSTTTRQRSPLHALERRPTGPRLHRFRTRLHKHFMFESVHV